MTEKKRCYWAEGQPEIYKEYHDKEWGIPLHNDRALFELLILEGAQAGLSWLTILKKREAYKKAFDNFDVKKVVTYDETKIQELLSNKEIIRNERKIRASVKNAQVFLEIQDEWGSFDKYIWHFVDKTPIQNHWKDETEVPAKTELSETISKDLKKKGMNFVGPTIIYAYMQAIGMVFDHTKNCFCYEKKHEQ